MMGYKTVHPKSLSTALTFFLLLWNLYLPHNISTFLGVNIQLITTLKQPRENGLMCIHRASLIIHMENLVHLCICHVHEVSVLHVCNLLLLRDVNSNPQGLEKSLLLFCILNPRYSAHSKTDAQ